VHREEVRRTLPCGGYHSVMDCRMQECEATGRMNRGRLQTCCADDLEQCLVPGDHNVSTRPGLSGLFERRNAGSRLSRLGSSETGACRSNGYGRGSRATGDQ